MNKVLRIDNIFKSYKHKKVINGISFSVGQGEAIGLLGPNGAGKTTCFYMIAGLINVNSGKIFIDEVDITSLPMHQRASLGIGYLPQEDSIFRGMNVEDNIMSVLEIVNNNRQERIEMMEKLLDEFSIQNIRKSHALSLSGGERRRVEIARTLATNPLFILLDEPFAGVDPIAINDIRKMITHLKDRGIGVLITDHNVRETLSIVDKGYIVYDGKILASGTKDEIINHQDVKRVYLGESFSVN